MRGGARGLAARIERLEEESRETREAALCTCQIHYTDRRGIHYTDRRGRSPPEPPIELEINVFTSCADVRRRNEAQEARLAQRAVCPVHPVAVPVKVEIRFDLTGACGDTACDCHRQAGHSCWTCKTPTPAAAPEQAPPALPPPVLSAREELRSRSEAWHARVDADREHELETLALASKALRVLTLCPRVGCWHPRQAHQEHGCVVLIIGSGNECPCPGFLDRGAA